MSSCHKLSSKSRAASTPLLLPPSTSPLKRSRSIYFIFFFHYVFLSILLSVQHGVADAKRLVTRAQHGDKRPPSSKQASEGELDFHRLVSKNPAFYDVEYLPQLEKQLTRSDLFLDDFVPDEFIRFRAESKLIFTPRQMQMRKWRATNRSQWRRRTRRPRRDVDSNSIRLLDDAEEDGSVDIDDSVEEVEQGSNPQVDQAKDANRYKYETERRRKKSSSSSSSVSSSVRPLTVLDQEILIRQNEIRPKKEDEEDSGTASNLGANDLDDILLDEVDLAIDEVDLAIDEVDLAINEVDIDVDRIMQALKKKNEPVVEETTTTTTTEATIQVPALTINMLKERIMSLEASQGTDRVNNYLQALNITLEISRPEQEQELLQLVLRMVKDLENKRTRKNPPLCRNVDQYKIQPGDSKPEVQRKQAALMECYMNHEVDPCDRFFEYACGRWEHYHPIPNDKGGYDTFEILREDLNAHLIEMFEQPLSDKDNNATAAVKLLYASCMDTDSIEVLQERPLLDLLGHFGGWPVLEGSAWKADNFSWINLVTSLRHFNNDILVMIWVGPDGKDSNDFIVQFDQSDLLLPAIDYYTLGFEHPILQSYYNLLINTATLLGADTATAKKDMKDLILFETELAMIMIPPHSRRNFSEIYKKMPMSELQAKLPTFDFQAYLTPLLPRKLNDSEEVVIYALSYYQKLVTLLDSTPSRVISNYVLWRFIRHRLNNLDSRFQGVQNDLFRVLFGREETPPRWRFCVSYVNGNLGNSVGSMFVKKYFDEQSKRDMEALTDEVQDVFRYLVINSDWLTNETKVLADEKIQAIIHNIGYADFITDEAKLEEEEIVGLEYKKEMFFENVLNNLQVRTVREMLQLDKKVNRTLWTATPAVVNAYYSRNRNQIMFPAGILQPPFYHKHFPKALNYGGIGVVIGHEITHGFDDKGRQFDNLGNIDQWWDHESSRNFKERKQCIIDQYGDYEVEGVDIHINGANTQGENIADNGGIKQAYYAYKNWLTSNGIAKESLTNNLSHLSGDQLFFLNFAQVWCGNTRPEALRSKLKTAVHAPGEYRVLGTLSNSEEFSRAFQCPVGTRMNPKSKCKVW